MRLRNTAGVALAAVTAISTPASAQNYQLQDSYNFLVFDRSAGGALFTFSNAGGDYLLPSSFLDSADYWGSYVCEGSRERCAVNNTYNNLDYQLLPPASPAGKLQVERVNAHNSANIYDIATWQIAVMLGFVKGKLLFPWPTGAYPLASGLTEILQHSGAPGDCSRQPGVKGLGRRDNAPAFTVNQADCNSAPGAKRAVTADKTFVYNGQIVADSRSSYAFRAMAPEWLARDPLSDSKFSSFVTASNLPSSNPAYKVGKVTWTDWKPITGENAWAFLIGPLQAAHLHYVVFEKKASVPFSERAIQNALDVLPTFAAMQSDVGGVHYAPAGTVGNDGGAQVNGHEVSVENNFSLYAGLQILRRTLRTTLDTEKTLAGADKDKINSALRLIDSMIDGGSLGPGRETKGLRAFFKDAAWSNGVFVQGGLANDPAQNRAWMPSTDTMAVDVQTWGVAALGAQQIDAWFGAGASFALWQRTKAWGGYGVGKTLWGVGYSNHDGNGSDQSGAYKQGVLSAEWTAGAIMAVRNMLAYYSAASSPQAKSYVESLKQDEASMLKAMTSLRIDQYAATNFPGKPLDYAKLMPLATKPYLYASKRYYIPFGWYANPLPSTASTAWVFMLAYRYDPFGFDGAPN